MTEDEIRGLLREMREDPVPAASLQRVRSQVRSRMERTWSRLATWALVAAGLALAVLFLRPQARHNVENRVPRAVTPAVAPLLFPEARARSPEQTPAVRPAVRRVQRRVEKREPGLTIRMETPDPDVVIILLGQ